MNYLRPTIIALLALAALLAAGDAHAVTPTPVPLNTNAATDFGGDFSPQVATDGAAKWVAVWQSNDDLGGTVGMDFDILVTRSTDNGATWTAPAALNSNAATDSRWDGKPQVKRNRAGTSMAKMNSIEMTTITQNGTRLRRLRPSHPE